MRGVSGLGGCGVWGAVGAVGLGDWTGVSLFWEGHPFFRGHAANSLLLMRETVPVAGGSLGVNMTPG